MGNEWRQFTYQSDIQNRPSGRGRGVYGGQMATLSMDYINIASKGNSIYFGDFLQVVLVMVLVHQLVEYFGYRMPANSLSGQP